MPLLDFLNQPQGGGLFGRDPLSQYRRQRLFQDIGDTLLSLGTGMQQRSAPGINPLEVEEYRRQQQAREGQQSARSTLLGGLDPRSGITWNQPRQGMPESERLGLLGQAYPEQFGKAALTSLFPNSSDSPSNVREWMFFNQLTPEQKDEYLTVKRANPYLNIGGEMVQPAPTQPGKVAGRIPKTLPPEEQPALKGEQARAAAEAKAEVEKQTEAPVAAAKATLRVGPLDRMSATTQEVLDAPGLDKILGEWSLVPILPGTERADAEAKLATLESQISQNVLQMYREMSQTGGAVGQVSNFEQELFKNNLAALKRSQTPEEFRKQLQKIQQFVEGSKERIKAAYEMQFGQPFPEAAPEAPPETPPQGEGGDSGWSIQRVE